MYFEGYVCDTLEAEEDVDVYEKDARLEVVESFLERGSI
jgi:hypothetical protein